MHSVVSLLSVTCCIVRQKPTYANNICRFLKSNDDIILFHDYYGKFSTVLMLSWAQCASVSVDYASIFDHLPSHAVLPLWYRLHSVVNNFHTFSTKLTDHSCQSFLFLSTTFTGQKYSLYLMTENYDTKMCYEVIN